MVVDPKETLSANCNQVIKDTSNTMAPTYHVASQPILPSMGKLDFLNR